jgi:hypothetical protein
MKNQRLFRNFFAIAFFLFIGFAISAIPAKADMGIAPPSMRFSITFNIPQTPIIEGHLLICEDSECEKYSVFEKVNFYSYSLPNFYCAGENNDEWCYAGVGDDHFREYHKISLLFEDGVTRSSNVFQKRGNSSYYKLKVNEADLWIDEDVEKNRSFFNVFSPYQIICFLPAAFLTLVTEVQVAKLYSKKLKKVVKHIALANLISLPIVWFIIPGWLEIKFLWLFIIVELFAVIFEAIFIFWTNRASRLTFTEGAIISLIINVSSIGVGIVLGGIVLLVAYALVIR